MTKEEIEGVLRLYNSWLRGAANSPNWSDLFQRMFRFAQMWEYGE